MNNFLAKLAEKKEFLLTTGIYTGLFFFLLYPYRDFDWGWHYRYGQYLLAHGQLLSKDPFSWTMDGYQWINHSWLYDPILYLIFQNFSFLGMSLAGALVSFGAFYFGIKAFKLSFWQKGVLALFFCALVSGVVWQGLRSQMISMLLLSILMYLLVIYQKKKWVLFVLPFLFLLWANLHGTVTMGVVIFGIWLGSSIVIQPFLREKSSSLRQNLLLILTFFVCVLATLFNPFTYQVYLEAIRHANHPFLPYISEWTPPGFPSLFYTMLLLYSVLLLLGFLKVKKLRYIPFFLISIFLFYLSVKARRYVADYAVVTMPFAAALLSDLGLRLEKFKVTTLFFAIAVIVTIEIGIFVRIPMYHLLSYSFDDYCYFASKCSEGLTRYLTLNPPQGKGFNFYDWGGYLIGKGIPAKLFIDGRMHLWERKGYAPFIEYQKIYWEDDFEKFKKYDFDWAAVETNSYPAKRLRLLTGFGIWKLEYEDENGSYFVRLR